MNTEQLKIIKTIFNKAEEKGIMLWLDGGWAMDFLLGRITREHTDIDIVFEKEKEATYKNILNQLGFVDEEKMDYGFLTTNKNILIDSECCENKNSLFFMDGYPDNSFPMEKEGNINNFYIRCVSWEKMFIEFLWLEKQVERVKWEPRHFVNLKILEEKISKERRKELRNFFDF